MASWAEAHVEAPAARPRGRGSRARAANRPRPRHVTPGLLWIVALALLLAGVVAVNVAVLQLNMRLDELDRERSGLQAENARLSAQLSSASASARIEAEARRKLGVERADPSTTSYVELPAPR